jgi:hypothetical protein
MTAHRRIRHVRRGPLARPAAGGTRQVVGGEGLLAEVGVRGCPRPEPAGGGQRPGRSSPAGRRGWEPAGNELRSDVRCGALGCSPVRGVHLRKHGNDLVAGMGVLSWGSRGRRFKSGRPDWFFEHLLPQLGTKIAQLGMIMPAVPRAHTANPGRPAEQPQPSTPPGAPRRGPVRQNR